MNRAVWTLSVRQNKQQIGTVKATEPARDNRYPAFAGRMTDARTFTDYRTHCAENIAVGKQYNTKQFMVHNAEHIMEVSRQRQQEWTGGSHSILELAPPPAEIGVITPDTLDIEPTNALGGLGLERAQGRSPALFGTFHYGPSLAEEMNNISKIRGTVNFEGGRNSPRGRGHPAPLSPLAAAHPLSHLENYNSMPFAPRGTTEGIIKGINSPFQ